ncbi:synaptotagmin-like protein 2 isoform X2 [Clarias gariepinus]|uniref:synaptotagmin-like protein 2 isoform X2 n=1 Tax=Clarias gariepinus TaxID=13013 RepID=UPI00234E1067|nr:synaptotagmin-like protein 2 isoform X2 [Clarias gariepinus]
MIDLSYLTEEEQEAIMAVLKRDAELKKTEQERVKHLQKQGPEEGKLKYITGEWFYEVKSQRHQDRIHGSDIIMASMKQKKPMSVEFLAQSWKEHPNKTNNDLMTPQPKSTDSLKERRTTETQQQRVNRQRHNPFDNVPVDLDLDVPDSASVTVDITNPPAEVLPSLETHEEMEVKTKGFNISQETIPRQKPVPKKRTKIFNLQNSITDSTSSTSTQSVSTSSAVSTQSVSTDFSTKSPVSTQSISTSSDSRSTLSTQSMSTNSEIKSIPPIRILKHSFSCSSSDPNFKSQLPQPLKPLRMVSTKTGPEKVIKENTIPQKQIEQPSLSLKDEETKATSPESSSLNSTFPKSRLPVRSSLLLSSPTQTAQEKPKIQPRLSLSSSTQSNDEQKATDQLHAKQKCENSLNLSLSAEPKKQNIAEGFIKEPLSTPKTKVMSPFESLLVKPLNDSTGPQISPKSTEKEESNTSKKENKNTQEQAGHPLSLTAQLVHEATDPSNKIDASFVTRESEYRPHPFNMKITRRSTMKTQDSDPLMVNSPKASEEQGDSIAKVLEWFSRSSESSGKPDCEDNIQDTEDDIKIEDIDFEDEVTFRPIPENNVYLIIPRHSDEDAVLMNDAFLKERNIAVEPNLDKEETSMSPHGVHEPIGQPYPLSLGVSFASTELSHRSHLDTANTLQDPKKLSLKEPETASKKGESRNADKTGVFNSTPTQHKVEDPEESKSAKSADLRALLDIGTAEAPRTLLSKPNINSERKNYEQNIVGMNVPEHKKEPNKVDISPKYLVFEKMNDLPVQDFKHIDKMQSNGITYEPLNKKEVNDKEKAEDMQAPVNNMNGMEDIIALSTTSDKDVAKPLSNKSLSLQDSGSKIEDLSKENVEGKVYPIDEGRTKEVVWKIKTELNESQQNCPTSDVDSRQQNAVPLKQGIQQQDNRAERIKELKSFWEREQLQPNIYMKATAANDTNSSAACTKLNKRFTKSEYDLRSIGTESEEQTANFTVIPLRDKLETTVTAERMDRLQFKMLRDFWAGSSKQSPNFENINQNPLHQEVKHTKLQKQVSQPEVVNEKYSLNQKDSPIQSDKGFVNESGNALSPKTDRGLQFSLQEKTAIRHPDAGTTATSSTESDMQTSDHCPQQKDTTSSKSAWMANKESQLQIRTSKKGTIHGRGNSLRRATSMFALHTEVPDNDLLLQSQEVTTESTMLPSSKTPEANLQVKKSPEITASMHKASERSTPEDSDSQPLARSLIPGDYQDYLDITGNRGKFSSPQVTEQRSDIVCTPFQAGDSGRCCYEKADTLQDSAKLFTRRGSLELQASAHANEDVNPKSVLNRDNSFSGTSANSTEVSLVQEVLRRAATRPVYHKSLEDITALPRQTRKSKRVDDSMPSSYAISSTPSPSSSSFSDKEHLRKISKSVPSFLENENDGDVSDSECSSHSGKYWKYSSPQTKPSNISRMPTVSSMSSSILSLSSVDFANVDVQGTIQFSINYVQKLREFHIFVVQCQNLAAVDVKRNRSDPYVKSYLIPDTANLGKRKTSVKKKTLNPTYNEILRYRVRMEYLKTQMLNLSVWHNDTFGRNSFLGETEIDLSKWDFENPQINCLSLKPRNIGSILSTDDRGEMRLAIRFLPHSYLSKSVLGSGEIHIWVKDCKNLPSIRGSVNPYVKCCVLPDTSKKSCQKTRLVKKTASPVFNHTMVYDGFRTEDLKEACVELAVWNHDRLVDHLVGGLRLGLGTGESYGKKVDWMDSTATEIALWQRMMDSPSEWVEDVLPLRMVATAKNTRK